MEQLHDCGDLIGARVPVFIVTGFLGAGKSTLLHAVLGAPGFERTAVVINEFGDIALDHDLVRVGPSQIARVTTGCLCCTAGSDIRTTLHELHVLAQAGEVAFDRVIVETTGLADPAPLINDLIAGGRPAFGLRDHTVASSFELAGVITLVDAVTGELSIENHFEAGKQVAFADRILITKTDLARDPAFVRDVAGLKAQLVLLNPAAAIMERHSPGFDASILFEPRPYMPAARDGDVAGWLALDTAIRAEDTEARHNDATHGFTRHGARIRTFSIVREEPIEPAALGRFLRLISSAAGPRLLRVKGLVQLAGEPLQPRLLHVVQHVVYPTRALLQWPGDDRRTRLVFITDGLEEKPVRQLLEAALDGHGSSMTGLLGELRQWLGRVKGRRMGPRVNAGHRP